MTSDNRVVAGVAVAAVLGAVAAYLVFTPQGRRTLDNMDAGLADVTSALEKIRRALRRADDVVLETAGVVDEVRTILRPGNA